MIAQNALNPEKRGKIVGHTFHCFFLDVNTAVLYDKDMVTPIIWGNKTVVKSTIRKLPELMESQTARVRVLYYILAPPEFKMRFKYDGLVTKIIIPNF
jgi:hypothetical protein